MGDPRKTRKKYDTPQHPWQKERMDQESVFLKEYGLKNKKEIWKMNYILRSFALQAKKLISLKSKQAEKEKELLLEKLKVLGLLPATARIEDVLGLSLKDILERRLQTKVFRNDLAKSIKQSRQFIVHHHIFVGDKKITSPSYLVKVNEEAQLTFASKSPYFDVEHPERNVVKEEIKEKKPKKEETKKVIKKGNKKNPKKVNKDVKKQNKTAQKK